MSRLLTILLLFLSSTAVGAQNEKNDSLETALPTDVYAYYVVVAPGETISSILGHAAIRMVCPSAGLDYCFTIKTPEFKEYWDEMNYCIAFAKCNRQLMMERIKEVIVDALPLAEFEPTIDIAHNYAAFENHFGHNCIVHRKGAVRARAGEIGIIPGSQGTSSYIVEGLGNPDSFMSSSHGAGRLMSRSQAIKTLNLQDEIKKMESKGIVHSIRSQRDLDEAASAYKDIDQVIALEDDLVKVKTKLEPIAVIKG